MAVKGQPGEHLAAARELLAGLEPITGQPGGDAHTRAIAATAHAVLALAEQVGMVRRDLATRAGWDPDQFRGPVWGQSVPGWGGIERSRAVGANPG
jgi:hypothetical protein